MTEDFYVVAIVALLPLTASVLVFQVNPYHALVIRGILGAVAALVYALFGAADVALTEALVGTMLSITLYAVAVRSSLIMRVGVLAADAIAVPKRGVVKNGVANAEETPANHTTSNHPDPSEAIVSGLRTVLRRHHMRLELVTYQTPQELNTALKDKDVHATCIAWEDAASEEVVPSPSTGEPEPYHLQMRIHRLYEIMQAELQPTLAHLSYVQPVVLSQSNVSQSNTSRPNPVEV